MPTYLCHGFRWQRSQIRIFVIAHQIDDATPDWVIGDPTADLILEELHSDYNFIPDPADFSSPSSIPPAPSDRDEDRVLSQDWSAIKLLEEHDPSETREATRPYAFVAEHVIRVDLDVDAEAEMARLDDCPDDRAWFHRLRDEIQPDEDIRWYVVVCGDQDRPRPTPPILDLDLPPPESLPEPAVRVPPEPESSPTTSSRSQGQRGWPGLRRTSSMGDGLRRVFRRKDSSKPPKDGA